MAVIPFLLLGAAAIVLGMQYDALPDRLVAHWGLKGADRWVVKSWRSVFGVLIIGAAVLGVLAAARASIRRAPVRSEWEGRYRAHHGRLVLAIAFCCALLFCNIALAPIGDPAATPVPFWISLVPTHLAAVWGIWRHISLQSEPDALPEPGMELPDKWTVAGAALALPLLIWLVAP